MIKIIHKSSNETNYIIQIMLFISNLSDYFLLTDNFLHATIFDHEVST